MEVTEFQFPNKQETVTDESHHPLPFQQWPYT